MPPTVKSPINTQGGWGISSVAGASRSYASEEERQKDNRRLTLVRGATGEDFGTTSVGFTVTGVNDLIAFGIPNNVPQGIQDVIISAAGGSITFENAVRILGPRPSPTPSSSGNPSSGSVPVVVSNSLSSFFTNPFEPNLFSVLTLQQDSFGNSARWLGLPPGQTGTISYPKVPDICNPGSIDNELPLQIDFQVAHNETQGGTITVSSGNEVVTFPGTEGQVMTQVFPFAASESSGRSVTFQLSGIDPNAQIIFVIKAKP